MAKVRNNKKIYVSNLNRDISKEKIGRLFESAGKITSLEYKGKFCFIEYDTEESAMKAIRY